jgi:hypothetical protein
MGSKYDHLRMNVAKLRPGEAFIASQGEEFSCEPVSFQGVIYRLALQKGGGWKATTVIIGQDVVYAFYRMSDYLRPNLPAYPIVKKLRGEM